ncbi:MAG: hypothetical protein QM718_15230 [Steroidobacteraceae bacterium]
MPHYPANALSYFGRISLFWLIVCGAAARPAAGTSALGWALVVLGSVIGIIGISYCSHRIRLLAPPWESLSRSAVHKLRQTALLAIEYSLCLLLASALNHT